MCALAFHVNGDCLCLDQALGEVDLVRARLRVGVPFNASATGTVRVEFISQSEVLANHSCLLETKTETIACDVVIAKVHHVTGLAFGFPP